MATARITLDNRPERQLARPDRQARDDVLAATSTAVVQVSGRLAQMRAASGREETLAAEGVQVLRGVFTVGECERLEARMKGAIRDAAAYTIAPGDQQPMSLDYNTIPDPHFMHSQFARDMNGELLVRLQPTLTEYASQVNAAIDALSDSEASEEEQRMRTLFPPLGSEKAPVGLKPSYAKLDSLHVGFRESFMRPSTRLVDSTQAHREEFAADDSGTVTLAVYANLSTQQVRFLVAGGSHVVLPHNMPDKRPGEIAKRARERYAELFSGKNAFVLKRGDVIIYDVESVARRARMDKSPSAKRRAASPSVVFGTDIVLSSSANAVSAHLRRNFHFADDLSVPTLATGQPARLRRRNVSVAEWAAKVFVPGMMQPVEVRGRQVPLYDSNGGFWPPSVGARKFDPDFPAYSDRELMLHAPRQIQFAQTLVGTTLKMASVGLGQSTQLAAAQLVSASTVEPLPSHPAYELAARLEEGAAEEIAGPALGDDASGDTPEFTVPTLTVEEEDEIFASLLPPNKRTRLLTPEESGDSPLPVGAPVGIRLVRDAEIAPDKLDKMAYSALHKMMSSPFDVFNLMYIERGRFKVTIVTPLREYVYTWTVTPRAIHEYVLRRVAKYAAKDGVNVVRVDRLATWAILSYFYLFFGAEGHDAALELLGSVSAANKYLRDREGLRSYSMGTDPDGMLAVVVDPLFWSNAAGLPSEDPLPIESRAVGALVHLMGVPVAHMLRRAMSASDLGRLGYKQLGLILGAKVRTYAEFSAALREHTARIEFGTYNPDPIVNVFVTRLLRVEYEDEIASWFPRDQLIVPFRFGPNLRVRPQVDTLHFVVIEIGGIPLFVPAHLRKLVGNRAHMRIFRFPRDGRYPRKGKPGYRNYFHSDGELRSERITVDIGDLSLTQPDDNDVDDYNGSGRLFHATHTRLMKVLAAAEKKKSK